MCAGFRPVRDQSEHGIRASTGSERVWDQSVCGIKARTASERARDHTWAVEAVERAAPLANR